MMRNRNYIFLIFLASLFLMFNSCNDDPTANGNPEPADYKWTPLSDFPGDGRKLAVSFVVNNLAYVGLGEGSGIDFYKDFYCYNPTSDIWTKNANFAGVARKGGIAFVLANNAYVGLGYGNKGTGNDELNDIWKYDATSDIWTQLNDFPEYNHTLGACSFVVGGKAYVLCAKNRTLYEYDAINDSWILKNDIPYDDRRYASAFVIDNIAFLGLGWNDGSKHFEDVWQYDVAADSWTEVSVFAGGGKSHAMECSIGNYGIIVAGSKFAQETADAWRYDAVSDVWEEIVSYPGGNNLDGVCFVIGNEAYAGIGVSGLTYNKSFYKLDY